MIQRIYIDTSVIGGLFDIEFSADTKGNNETKSVRTLQTWTSKRLKNTSQKRDVLSALLPTKAKMQLPAFLSPIGKQLNYLDRYVKLGISNPATALS